MTYDNVFLLFLDASGYSSIVGRNPRDRAAYAFDLLRTRVTARVLGVAERHGCARAELWSWRGDGGFLIVHDDDESVARDVVLEAARTILMEDLPRLREELDKAEFRGGLHVRIAVHKGPIRVPVERENGSIHSPDVNFGAHLEEVAPADRLVVSGGVYRVSGPFAELFERVGDFEGHEVYLMRSADDAEDGRRVWLRTAGLAGAVGVHAYPQRPSQRDKARLVETAAGEVVDLGTALNTCASLLVTTERPAVYRDAVLGFLRRGGTYRCVLLDPSSEVVALLTTLRGEDLAAKIDGSLAKFARFKERHGPSADRLEVYRTVAFTGMAALCSDPGTSRGLILYSPYLLGAHPTGFTVDRADMPHYLAGPEAGRLHQTLSDVVAHVTAPERLERVL
ncbi:hypothetical protein [Saccharothrix yanglingensis]|uniref:hypothetical protein n=1 Tax=Saccharothrix yanglingensis TaxID=659496 RepID=UPI0027D2FD40|nr:hypothetical protein [Saccharothrix yanglingensis]